MARRAGWAALIVVVAATAVFVPPMVMPHPRQRVPAAAPPSPSPSLSPSAPVPVAVLPSLSASPAAVRFKTVSVHAADPANIRSGARVIDCASCTGGRRVGYIGGPNTLVVKVGGISVAGTRKLTVTYETEESRTLEIAVNDGAVHTLTLTGAHNLLIPATVSLSVFVPAGTSWIKFFNDAGPAPDINTIALS